MEVGFLDYPPIPGKESEQLVKTVAATNTPEAISATQLMVRQATILGKKAAQTNNTGTVHVGPLSADGGQPFDIASGEAGAILRDPSGFPIDLAQWYVDVENAGDGVVVIYDR